MENQARTVSFFRFEDLRVYDKALDYFVWTMQQTQTASEFEKKVILQPLSTSAAKIAENIAEGSARHKPQFIQFLKDAKSSIRNCVVLSTLAYKDGVFDQSQYDQSRETLVEMTKMVGAMIVSLQRNGERNSVSQTSSIDTDFNTDEGMNFEY